MKQVRRPLYPLQIRKEPEQVSTSIRTNPDSVAVSFEQLAAQMEIFKDAAKASGVSMAEAALTVRTLVSASKSIPLVNTGQLVKGIEKAAQDVDKIKNSDGTGYFKWDSIREIK